MNEQSRKPPHRTMHDCGVTGWAVVAIMLLAAYMGSYYWLVVSDIAESASLWARTPSFPYEPATAYLYYPAFRLDEQIRPGYWSTTVVRIWPWDDHD